MAKVLRDQKKSTGALQCNKRKVIAAELKSLDTFVSKYMRKTIVPPVLSGPIYMRCVKKGCGFSSCDPVEYSLHATEKGHSLHFVAECEDDDTPDTSFVSFQFNRVCLFPVFLFFLNINPVQFIIDYYHQRPD